MRYRLPKSISTLFLTILCSVSIAGLSHAGQGDIGITENYKANKSITAEKSITLQLDSEEELPLVNIDSGRIVQVINEILDVTRIEAGKVVLEMKPVSVAEIFGQAADLSGSSFEKYGLELTCNIEEGLPEIAGDKTRLEQVLINLFSNAIKFTERESQ